MICLMYTDNSNEPELFCLDLCIDKLLQKLPVFRFSRMIIQFNRATHTENIAFTALESKMHKSL